MDEHVLPKNLPSVELLTLQSRKLPELDPWAVYVLNELLRVSRYTQAELDRNFATYGITMGRYVTLLAIFNAGEATVGSSELADELGVTRATMTGLLDNLERDGLAARDRRDDDRRRVDVRITEKGVELLTRMFPDHYHRIRLAFGSLSQREREQLVRLLRKVEQGAQILSVPGAILQGEAADAPAEAVPEPARRTNPRARAKAQR